MALDGIVKVILIKTWEHLELTFISLFFALLIAIPLGIHLARKKSPKTGTIFIRIVSIFQTIPGLALIALIIVFLAFIRPAIHLPTTGFLPGVIVLVVYALLPILSSTYEGVKQVDSSLIEIAEAMGMTSKQELFWVQLPLALPVIINGVRMSLVITIGVVTLTSLVGSGGLGDLILQGMRTMQLDFILAGTIPACFLALVCDWGLEKIGKWFLPSQTVK